MQKGLSWAALVIGGLMVIFFLLDIITGFPFGGRQVAGLAVDIIGLLASGILCYLSWDTLRELR